MTSRDGESLHRPPIEYGHTHPAGFRPVECLPPLCTASLVIRHNRTRLPLAFFQSSPTSFAVLMSLHVGEGCSVRVLHLGDFTPDRQQAEDSLDHRSDWRCLPPGLSIMDSPATPHNPVIQYFDQQMKVIAGQVAMIHHVRPTYYESDLQTHMDGFVRLENLLIRKRTVRLTLQ